MNTEIAKLITSTKSEDDEWEEEMKRQEEETNNLKTVFKTAIRPNLRSATHNDYINWLKGFIANGGKPTHYYDYDMPNDFYVATNGFEIKHSFCGALSFQVIVPVGITIIPTSLGHCNLYLMDNFKIVGWWVPVYRNTIF